MSNTINFYFGRKKMKDKLLRKGIVLGIIVLFVGTNIVPANVNTKNIIANDKNYTAEISDDTIHYNLIGGVNISFDNFWEKESIKIEYWFIPHPYRNFTYPVENGMVKINYTLLFQTWSDGFFLMRGLAWFQNILYDFIDGHDKAIGQNTTWRRVKWTDFTPYQEYLYVESYPIPVPENGHRFYLQSIALGIIPLPLKWKIEHDICSFSAYFIQE